METENACTWGNRRSNCKDEGGVYFDGDGVAFRVCGECAEREGLTETDPLAGQTGRDYEPGDEISWREYHRA